MSYNYFSKRNFLWLTLGVGFLSLIFFWQALFSTFTGIVLKSYVKLAYDYELEYQNLTKTDNKWTFKGISLTAIDPNKPKLELEELSFETNWYSIYPRSKGSILIRNPKFFFPESLDRELLSKLFAGGGSFGRKQNVDIVGGELHFPFKVHSSKTETIYFAGQISRDRQRPSQIKLWNDKDRVVVELPDRHSQSEQIVFHIQKLSCPLLTELDHYFNPERLSLDANKGILSGEAKLTLTKEGLPILHGNLQLDDFQFYHQILQIKGLIPKAKLVLSQETNLALELPADLFFYREGRLFWSLHKIEGGIAQKQNDIAKLSLNGVYYYNKETLSLQVEGDADLSDYGFSFLNLRYLLEHADHREVSGSLVIRQVAPEGKIVDIQAKNFGKVEFDFFQNLLSGYFPQLNEIAMNSGVVAGNFRVNFDHGTLGNINLENLDLKDLDLSIDALGIRPFIREGKGFLTLDMKRENIWDSLFGELAIEKGSLKLLADPENDWEISNLNSLLKFEEGFIHDSLAEGNFAGVSGVAKLFVKNGQQETLIDVKGKAASLIHLLPDQYEEGFAKSLEDRDIRIHTHIQGRKKALHVSSEISVQGKNSEEERFSLGFEMARSAIPQNIFNNPLKDDLYISHFPNMLWNQYLFDRESGAAGFTIKNGWFFAKELPLAKYLAPWLFSGKSFDLEGLGDFTGTFDHLGIELSYTVKDFKLESPNLLIEIPEVGSLKRNEVGRHFYYFRTGNHHGSLPIYEGFYHEKNSGLDFTGIRGKAYFENGKVIVKDLDTYSKGMYLAGQIEVDYSNAYDGNFEVIIQTDTMHAKFSQVKDFFQHFNKPFLFINFPIEGNVAFGEKGGRFHFFFDKESYRLDTSLHGVFSDGSVKKETSKLALKDLNFNFDFDKNENNLLFSDIQGTVLVGNPEDPEEYAFVGDRIHFSDYERNCSEFDLWIGDKQRDFIRVVGKTACLDRDPSITQIFLDQTGTHIGDVHPDHFLLKIKDWTDVEEFSIGFRFNLETILNDLQRIARAELLDISPQLTQELLQLQSGKGKLHLQLGYDVSSTVVSFMADGKDIAIKDYSFQNFILHGKKKQKDWIIDELTADDFTLSADLFRNEDRWDIKFLGLRWADKLLLGLQGAYLDESKTVQAKINLFETDLQKSKDMAFLSDWLGAYRIKGNLKGGGELTLATNEEGKWQVDLSLLLHGKNLVINDLRFRNTNDFALKYRTGSYFSVEGLQTGLLRGEGNEESMHLLLNKISYDIPLERLAAEEIAFKFPGWHADEIAGEVKKSFPELPFDPRELSFLAKYSKDQFMEGVASYYKDPSDVRFDLHLKDATYAFNDTDHELKNLKIKILNDKIDIYTLYKLGALDLWVFIESPSLSFSRGKLILSDLMLDRNKEAQQVVVEWNGDPLAGNAIQSITGVLSGLQFHLKQNPMANRSTAVFDGEIKIFDPERAAKLISQDSYEKMKQFQLGSGYTIKGQWRIEDYEKNRELAFDGQLLGKDFIFKGYRLKSLASDLSYKNDHLSLKNVKVDDNGMSLQAPAIEAIKGGASWNFQIPQLIVSDLKPSSLMEVDNPIKTQKPFVIRKMEIQELHGRVGDANSITGKGCMHFQNPIKKSLQNTIFAIPAEILARIGLDLSVLTPVMGTVFYDIGDGKIFLTRFKDVYSDKKLSKFYLPDNGYDSYVDFEGNLHVQIRMKQYNLVFKLAELFTVTIKGTYQKPTYSLQKQAKNNATQGV